MQNHKCNEVENAFPIFKVSRLVRLNTDSHHNGHNKMIFIALHTLPYLLLNEPKRNMIRPMLFVALNVLIKSSTFTYRRQFAIFRSI